MSAKRTPAFVRRLAEWLRLDRTRGSAEFTGPCPVCKATVTLTWKTGDEPAAAINCPTGCDVLAFADLTDGDLHPVVRGANTRLRERPFVYRTADGIPVYRVCVGVRKANEPKSPRWVELFIAGRWRAKKAFLPETDFPKYERLLFGAHHLDALSDDETVFFTEGESDARALQLDGYVAVTVAFASFRGVDVTALSLFHVIVVVDNDPTGWTRGRRAVEALTVNARSVETYRPPEDYKDVRDLLDRGGAISDLIEVDLDFDPAPTGDIAPLRTTVTAEEGVPFYEDVPTDALIAGVQLGYLEHIDVLGWHIANRRAGMSSEAHLTVQDYASLVGVGWHAGNESINRLAAVGFVKKNGRRLLVWNPSKTSSHSNAVISTWRYAERPEQLSLVEELREKAQRDRDLSEDPSMSEDPRSSMSTPMSTPRLSRPRARRLSVLSRNLSVPFGVRRDGCPSRTEEQDTQDSSSDAKPVRPEPNNSERDTQDSRQQRDGCPSQTEEPVEHIEAREALLGEVSFSGRTDQIEDEGVAL